LFRQGSSPVRSDADGLAKIVVSGFRTGGLRTGWVLTAADESIYGYDADGVWLSVGHAGMVTTLT